MSAFVSAFLSLLITIAWIVLGGLTLRARWLKVTQQDAVWPMLFSALGLALVACTVNLLAGLRVPAALFVAASVGVLPWLAWRLGAADRRQALAEGLSLAAVCTAALGVIHLLYAPDRFWLLDPNNHDSMIYFEGLLWAFDNPLLTSRDQLLALWGVPPCGTGASGFIGIECDLHRNGTYTLNAWSQLFSPRPAASAVWTVGAYSGILCWLAVRVLLTATVARRSVTRTATLAGLLAALPLFASGWVSTLANANLGTTLACGLIALTVAVAALARETRQKAVLLGLTTALASHVYSEAAFYCAFVTGVTVAVDAIRIRGGRLRQFMTDAGVAFGTFLLAAHWTAWLAIKSYFAISAVATSQPHASWYLAQPVWTWLGAFFAADLLGVAEVSSTGMAAAGAVMLVLTCLLVWRTSARAALIALAGMSVLLIGILVQRQFQYGEHKLLQLLGPAWSVLLVAALVLPGRVSVAAVRQTGIGPAQVTRFLLVLLGIGTQWAFAERAYLYLRGMEGVHGLHHGIERTLAPIRPGDSVALDDSAFAGIEKYQKSHYPMLLLQRQGGRMVMPDVADNALRGGYYRNALGNTFAAGSPRWFLSGISNGAGPSPFHPRIAPVAGSGSYDLFDAAMLPGVALPAHGWFDGERGFVWTTSPFGIEVQTRRADAELALRITAFAPPPGGSVQVNVNGMPMGPYPATQHELRIPLPAGFSRVQVSASWEPRSPRDIGMSGDPRRLFAQVWRAEVRATERRAN
jgi:hypothetical protein